MACTATADSASCEKPKMLDATPVYFGARRMPCAMRFGSARPWPKENNIIGTNTASGCTYPSKTSASAPLAASTRAGRKTRSPPPPRGRDALERRDRAGPATLPAAAPRRTHPSPRRRRTALPDVPAENPELALAREAWIPWRIACFAWVGLLVDKRASCKRRRKADDARREHAQETRTSVVIRREVGYTRVDG